jgi:hypothetical protein
MTNFKLNDFIISIGLCEITYGDSILPSLGDQGVFKALPTYDVVSGGKFNTTQEYFLKKYDVSFEVSFDQEALEMMPFYMPTLINDEANNGYYDNPQKVSMSSNKLIIHPYLAKNSKQFDICIWDAFIDPETGIQRVYGKDTNKYKVRFIGKPVIEHTNPKFVDSYFYIGDWSKVGDTIAK